MSVQLGRSRIIAVASALLTACLIIAVAGCRSMQTKDSERARAANAYFVTIEEEFQASENPPPPRLKNHRFPLERREYAWNLEIRHFRIEAPAGELQDAVETLKAAGSAEKRARLAETDPRYELRRKPDFAVLGTQDPAWFSEWESHGGYAIITNERFEPSSSSLDDEWFDDRSFEMKRSGPDLFIGRPVRDGFVLEAQMDSYDGETGEGKLSVAYLHVRKERLNGYLILEKEHFTSGESLCFIRPESCRRIFADGIPQKLAEHFRALEVPGDNE